MTWMELKEPPQDRGDFIEAPEKNTLEQTEWNLKELLKMRTLNIKTINFDVRIIQNLEAEILKSGYRIQFIPYTGPRMVAYADFYLIKV